MSGWEGGRSEENMEVDGRTRENDLQSREWSGKLFMEVERIDNNPWSAERFFFL